MLATQLLQFMYVRYGGFRWPIAYFATTSAKPCTLYSSFWTLVQWLKEYGFSVRYCMLDGSIMNRTFTQLMFKGDPCQEMYVTRNPFNRKEQISIVQDIKHCLKKIRN